MENKDEKLDFPVSGKLNADQFIRMTRLKNREKMDGSMFVRLAVVLFMNTLEQNDNESAQSDKVIEEKLDAIKLRFLLEAYEKYLQANKLPIPNNKQLLTLWKEGKYETQPFGRVKTLVEPKPLPKWIKSEKDID